MPSIEFTYTIFAGEDLESELEVKAEYDPPDYETGITSPRITEIHVSRGGVPIYLSSLTEAEIYSHAITLLREPPSN